MRRFKIIAAALGWAAAIVFVVGLIREVSEVAPATPQGGEISAAPSADRARSPSPRPPAPTPALPSLEGAVVRTSLTNEPSPHPLLSWEELDVPGRAANVTPEEADAELTAALDEAELLIESVRQQDAPPPTAYERRKLRDRAVRAYAALATHLDPAERATRYAELVQRLRSVDSLKPDHF